MIWIVRTIVSETNGNSVKSLVKKRVSVGMFLTSFHRSHFALAFLYFTRVQCTLWPTTIPLSDLLPFKVRKLGNMCQFCQLLFIFLLGVTFFLWLIYTAGFGLQTQWLHCKVDDCPMERPLYCKVDDRPMEVPLYLHLQRSDVHL